VARRAVRELALRPDHHYGRDGEGWFERLAPLDE